MGGWEGGGGRARETSGNVGGKVFKFHSNARSTSCRDHSKSNSLPSSKTKSVLLFFGSAIFVGERKKI